MDFFCVQAHSILTLEESSPSKENADICGHVLHEPHNPSLCLLSDPGVDFLEVQLGVATQCPRSHLVGLLELAVKSRPCPESWGIKTWILQLAPLSKQSQGSRWQSKAQQQVSHKIYVPVCLQKPTLKRNIWKHIKETDPNPTATHAAAWDNFWKLKKGDKNWRLGHSHSYISLSSLPSLLSEYSLLNLLDSWNQQVPKDSS